MALEKLDLHTLPQEVQDAYYAAAEWLAEKFKGRRTVPVPFVASMPVAEEDGVAIYAILVPPTGSEARRRIETAGASSYAVRDKGGAALAEAIAKMHDVSLVECCFWAGIPALSVPAVGEVPAVERPALLTPEAGHADPRVRARDFLKGLREEPGSLADAFSQFANQVAKMLAAPEASLGKT